MSLDLLNDLLNSTKDSNLLQGFVKELGEYLQESSSKKSYLDQVQEDKKVTVKYRDKMYVERNNILNSYAKETAEKGTMYYIYSKTSGKNDSFNICICEDGKSQEIIEVAESDLPEGAKVDTVLRMEDGKYVLDSEATQEISKQVEEMVNNLLKEQEQELEQYRIDGHIYEVGEKGKDRVWLYDITNGDENGIQGIEEIDFPEELLNEVEEGSKVIYENGSYQIYTENN